MVLGKKIKYLREMQHINRSELADLIGLTYHALSKYETGEREPDYNTLCKFARYFHVSTDYLLGLSEKTEYISVVAEAPTPQDLKLPILGVLHADRTLLASANFIGELPVPVHMQGDFILQVNDDSMVGAGILDGDYIICRETENAQDGQIVAAVKDQSAEPALLRYYFVKGKRRILRAAHPAYRDMKLLDGYRVAGIMAGLIRKNPPEYHIYRDYLKMSGDQDWAQVIEIAGSSGMQPEQVKEILAAQIEIAKRLQR
ncbi:MAG TPA: S24 family peptidase [Syntrophomonadaceae bacterium]|nr:S24 family peptidase [Syntrophomonadaceae bacterium]